MAVSGTAQSSTYTLSLKYGQGITYTKNGENLSFVFNGTTITYTAITGWRFDSLTITKDGNTSNTDALSSITGNIIIMPTYARWFTVTFATIGNTTEPTSSRTIEVKGGDSITATLSTDQKTLTYSYNGSNVVYRASQYYILSNGSNTLKVSADKTITPVTIFYACTVTMGNIETGVGTRSVTGDTYGTANDGTFVVEYGTTVNFAIDTTTGLFKYTYTFSSGEVVTYTISNEQYAMQYTIDSNGERASISNGLNGTFNEDSYTFAVGTTSKNISPIFGLKQYVGELG